MRRGLLVLSLLVLALLGFYVAWPAWSARQIRQAIAAEDAVTLAAKIDFPRVRESVRPIAAAQVARSMERLQRESGPLGAAIAGTLNKSLGTQLADAAVNSILTPTNVIRMVREGTDLRRAIDSAAGRDIRRTTGRSAGAAEPGGDTGRGGDAPKPGEPKAVDKPRGAFGLANIKSYRITGPLRLSVAVARDPAATEPDLTAELEFSGFDWKVVGLVPRI